MPKRKATDSVNDAAETVNTNRRSGRGKNPPAKEESPEKPVKSKKTSVKSKAAKKEDSALSDSNGAAEKKLASKVSRLLFADSPTTSSMPSSFPIVHGIMLYPPYPDLTYKHNRSQFSRIQY